MSETTADTASLRDASSAISDLLSPTEDPQTKPTQPEPSSPTETTQQAPPAPEPTLESEAVESEQQESSDDPQPPTPRTLKLKLPDGEVELTEEEVTKGYLRNSDYTRKTQALAEEKRKFESEEAQQIRAVRSQFSDKLAQVEDVLTVLHPPEPDWEARARVVPDTQLASEMLEWQKGQKALAQIREERARIAAQENEDAQRGFQQYLALEQAKLEEAIPEFRDTEKRSAWRTALQEFGQTKYGFNPEEFGRVTDSRLVRLLHDAMQFHAQQVKAPEIRNKIENAVTTTAPGAKQTSRKSGVEDLVNKATKSGSERDAVNAIGALLKQKPAA